MTTKITTYTNVLSFIFFTLGYSLFVQAAQEYYPQIANPLEESWRWHHFAELEGKGIRHIVETSNQKVWASYNDGVLEYDGYSWRKHDAENGLTASPVEQLLATSDSTIFATTSKGIFRYNGEKWQLFFEAPDNVSLVFHGIEQLKDGSIVASSDWGFIRFNDENSIAFYTSLPKKERLQRYFPSAQWVLFPTEFLNEEGDFSYVSDILEGKNNEVWLALTTELEEGKLLKFQKEEWDKGTFNNFEVIEEVKGMSLGEGQKMLLDLDGKTWVVNSTSYKGIFLFDDKQHQVIHLNKEFGGDEYMTHILQSDDGTIWISSMARIFTFQNNEWKRYRAPHFPIPANQVTLQNSRNNRLWVVGYKSKAILLDYSTDRWLTYQNLSFQVEVSPKEQWFLEKNNRLVLRTDENWLSYGVEDGLMDKPIRVIQTSKGQIWAAGSHDGVATTALFRDGKWERHIHSKLSWGIDYRAVFEAKDGSLWFGGSVDGEKKYGFSSGVLQLNNPDLERENLDWIHHPYQQNGLGQANVYGIGQSEDGRIWIGGSQLMYFDGNTWKVSEVEKLQQYVNVVFSTNDLLLVGSRYYGLFIYDGKTWENHNTSTGLSGNTIISIDVLQDNSILVATENNISRFDGVSWTHNVLPTELNMDFEGGSFFHTGENTIWINHVPRTWKRRAFRGSPEKVMESDFFTTRFRPDSTAPDTEIDFYVEKVSPEGNSIISWKGKDFFVQTPVEQLTFSYRLDGKDWSPFSKANQETFVSLPSGMHTLEVRARDLDFNTDKSPAVLTFNVLPPIWKQTWFILLLLTFATIFGIYEYRVLTKKRKLEILNESLQTANSELKKKSQQIVYQNREILSQQAQILAQSEILETNNLDLAERNNEIRSQRDKLEEMIVKVENLSKSKMAFFTNISHELRTPLTLILGPITQLQKEEKSLSIAAKQRLYKIIRNNTNRLLKLINQLLEIRQIEENTLKLQLCEIQLSQYISEITDLFENLAQNRKITLQFVNECENAMVAIDCDKIEKILVNLLSNAFKFTPESGSISLKLNTVSALQEDLNPIYDQYFKLEVADTGIGISQEKIDFIFEQFYTSKPELSDVGNSGIGLSYVRDLVYLMQGEILVESELDKGTKFTLYLPYIPAKKGLNGNTTKTKSLSVSESALEVAKKEASFLFNNFNTQPQSIETTNASDEATTKTALATILVVEDNPDMLYFLEHFLQDKYKVLTAENGKEGLEIALNETIDFIVSDVMMPEMDGITFCEKVKKNFATSHIPIILLTAKVLEQSKIAGFLKGADDYITKPFNPELLEIRINNLLNQRSKLRQIFTNEFMLTPKAETEIISSPDEELLQKLVDIMNEHYTEAEFNVNKMCKMVHLSHMHFIPKG